MQDNFLFDDDDPKQIGHGCDSLAADDKRLKFKWIWTEDWRASGGPDSRTKAGKKRTPSQISEALLENGWRLEAIFWHTDYEAWVERNGEPVATYHVRPGDEDAQNNKPLCSRIDAQLKAEQLFEEIGHDIVKQCKR